MDDRLGKVAGRPENTCILGWRGNRCLKRFLVEPELIGGERDGSISFLLADSQAHYQLRPSVTDFENALLLLLEASTAAGKVIATVDLVTNDIVEVSGVTREDATAA